MKQKTLLSEPGLMHLQLPLGPVMAHINLASPQRVRCWQSIVSRRYKKLPNTHLVMHGSSSVPKSLIDQINEAGGAIAETYGVPVEQIQAGIRSGVRKVNIDTDLRLAATAAIRQYLKKHTLLNLILANISRLRQRQCNRFVRRVSCRLLVQVMLTK